MRGGNAVERLDGAEMSRTILGVMVVGSPYTPLGRPHLDTYGWGRAKRGIVNAMRLTRGGRSPAIRFGSLAGAAVGCSRCWAAFTRDRNSRSYVAGRFGRLGTP